MEYAPYYAPPVNTWENIGGYGTIESYSAVGSCYFKTDQYGFAGVSPQCRFVYETYLFAISPENHVTRAQLLPRHTGVNFGIPTSLEVPIPENVYQPLCIEELGCVFWLHDMREVANADPMPTITVTNRTLDILYRIPASEMVPTDTFSTDQGTWAYAGEACYRYHNVDQGGPLMKSFKSPDGFFLVVGLEFYDRVEPGSGDPGTTTQRTCIFKVASDGYTLVKTSDATQGWTEPTVLSPEVVEGPRVVRSLAAWCCPKMGHP